MPIILENVSKSYGSTKVLAPTNLEISSGITTVIIGPSGSGKSTILRLIMGLILPTKGSIFIDDVRIAPENIENIRKNLGYVIQEGGLFPHLTAKDNIILMAKYLNFSKGEISKRLKDLSHLTQFPSTLLKHYPRELSGGERQKVSLMRALMLNPNYLLLDEPLGSLDPMIGYQLREELKEIFLNLKKTVILVTHDLSEAVHLGDEIILMKKGHILQRGTFSAFLNHPSDPFVTFFIKAQKKSADLLR